MEKAGSPRDTVTYNTAMAACDKAAQCPSMMFAVSSQAFKSRACPCTERRTAIPGMPVEAQGNTFEMCSKRQFAKAGLWQVALHFLCELSASEGFVALSGGVHMFPPCSRFCQKTAPCKKLSDLHAQ